MSAATIIHQLASLLKEAEHQIISGANHLSLTGETLKLVSDAIEQREKKDHAGQRLSLKQTNYLLAEDVKFLQDFFSRAPAVKVQGLLKNMDSGSCIDLTMFKSLQTLSIKRVPVTCVIGLSGMREQCKRLSCQRCLDNIKDLLLTCGADNTGPLSWSLLVDLDLSYNNITELSDESMKLCLSVQMLDLSHNEIVCDETGLQYLPDLCTLNLAYNKLESLPKLNRRACLCLTRLILRNNNLSVIVGIEYLKHLEDVDLSYNCLISHGDLSPFQQLNQLTTLFLSNNPLAFHSQHRCLTAARLSPHINPGAISLDGKRLSDTERRFLPKPDGYGLPSPANDPSYLTAVGESPSGQTCHPAGFPQRVTPKSKAGPRPVSIHENNTKKLEKTDKRKVKTKLVYDENDMVASQKKEEAEMLRRQIGDSWLMSYQENSRTSEGDEASTSACVDTSERTPNATSHQKEKPDLEAKSPKQQNVPDHCDDENYLADGVYKEIFNVSVEESDDDGHHVEIPRFVCITDRFVVEKDNSGKEIGRLDRTCLRNASVHRGESPGSECNASSSEGRSGRPIVQLEFDHARRDRRRRHYILENSTQSKTLLNILEDNVHTNKSVRLIRPKYECLKCSTVFERSSQSNYDISSVPDCPHCHSNHVVDQGSSSNGPSILEQDILVSGHSAPVSFKDPIQQSSSVMPIASTVAAAADGLPGKAASTEGQGASVSESANKSFEDINKTCASPDSEKSVELIPVYVFEGLDQSSTFVSGDSSQWHVDDSLARRDLNSSPFKHYRSLSQPWNDPTIDLGHYSQTRSKSQDNIGTDSGAELQIAKNSEAASWTLSVHEVYKKQSSQLQSGNHSHSTSCSVSQDSLLGDNSIEPAVQQPKSEELSLQTKKTVHEGSGPTWQGIDPDNCTKVHYRLRLYYDLNLFKDDNEEFDSHYRCSLVLCNQTDEQPGLVILSNFHCFICTCRKMPNLLDECSWINVIGSYPFDCLHLVTVGLGKQAVRLELSAMSAMSLGACSLLFCDAMRSSNFMGHLAACAGSVVRLAEICPWTLYNLRTQILDCSDLESLTEMAYDIESVISDSTNLIQSQVSASTFRQSIVGSDLVSWLCKSKMAPDKPKACALVQQLMDIGVLCRNNGQSTFEDNSSLYSFSDELRSRHKPFELFVLCQRILCDKESQGTVALMATTDCLYLLKQNFHQPEPVKSGPLLDQFSGPQFATLSSEKIVNISEMTVYKCHPHRLSVGFFENDDDGNKQQTWHLQLETKVTLDMVTAKVSELWKAVFLVNLELTVQS